MPSRCSRNSAALENNTTTPPKEVLWNHDVRISVTTRVQRSGWVSGKRQDLAQRERITESALVRQLVETMLRTQIQAGMPKLAEVDR
jgi:hypothetical protein